jgi:hypothetical protein
MAVGVRDLDVQSMFDAYVQTFPLTWNLHFFPQAFLCDGLGSHIADYSFVGHMDESFYKELARSIEVAERNGVDTAYKGCLAEGFPQLNAQGTAESLVHARSMETGRMGTAR